jgi:hypothetical protein
LGGIDLQQKPNGAQQKPNGAQPLDQILVSHAGENSPPGQCSCPSLENSAPQKTVGRCPQCNFPYWWRDPYGDLHCQICKPPVLGCQVREIVAADQALPEDDLPLPGTWERFQDSDGTSGWRRTDIDRPEFVEISVEEFWQSQQCLMRRHAVEVGDRGPEPSVGRRRSQAELPTPLFPEAK